MSLNDPFGRVSRRQRRAYAQLRTQLLDAGVRDADAVAATSRNIRDTVVKLALVIAAATLGLVVLFPQSRGTVLMLAALALLWLAANYLQTRGHLRHYLREIRGDADRHDN